MELVCMNRSEKPKLGLLDILKKNRKVDQTTIHPFHWALIPRMHAHARLHVKPECLSQNGSTLTNNYKKGNFCYPTHMLSLAARRHDPLLCYYSTPTTHVVHHHHQHCTVTVRATFST